jgi:pimeloyl-ACP methyl ester carboxylesterase
MMFSRVLWYSVAAFCGFACLSGSTPARAANWIAPGFVDAAPLGPTKAVGAVIWSHGRSLTREDDEAPTPPYLKAFAAAGWDVLRFNRPRAEDLLEASTLDLTRRVAELKQQGYRQIVLAGQSYGGFIAIGAARHNPNVHAVIATAPAAYGSFFDSYSSWQENAKALYRLLEDVDQTRVLLAFFHNDDYDPGGRGVAAQKILSARGVPTLIIDQPRELVGHLAANSGLFVRRYAGCLVAFTTLDTVTDECEAPPEPAPMAEAAIGATTRRK